MKANIAFPMSSTLLRQIGALQALRDAAYMKR